MKVFSEEIARKRSTIHPVEFSAWLHLKLVTIHPFIDGNGRTARLLMNVGLMQTGYVMSIIPPVLRNDYLTSLRLAQTGQKDQRRFINFITNVVYESTKDYLRLLRSLV
jgi:Fic family protein